MNLIIKLIFAVVTLFTVSVAGATEYHAAQALEHTAIGGVHGGLGHAKVLTQHAQEALKHAKASEREHAEAHGHIIQSVKHLKEAIKYGNMGQADVANKHINEAMTHIKATIGK